MLSCCRLFCVVNNKFERTCVQSDLQSWSQFVTTAVSEASDASLCCRQNQHSRVSLLGRILRCWPGGSSMPVCRQASSKNNAWYSKDLCPRVAPVLLRHALGAKNHGRLSPHPLRLSLELVKLLLRVVQRVFHPKRAQSGVRRWICPLCRVLHLFWV